MKNGCVIENPPTSNKTYTFEQVQKHRHIYGHSWFFLFWYWPILDTVGSRDADAAKYIFKAMNGGNEDLDYGFLL